MPVSTPFGVASAKRRRNVGKVYGKVYGTRISGKETPMRTRLALALALGLGTMTLAGCVPVVIGAGGAIAADTIAEDRGGDLF